MTTAILTYLKTTAVKHILFIALCVAGFVVFRSYMAEHDARLVAEGKITSAEKTVAALEVQQTKMTEAAKVEVTVLQKQADAVKTAPEAITALPTVSVPELKAEALPDAPDRVSVEAVPLYQELNACKVDGVNLSACALNLAAEKQITAQKDIEIAALKQKPSFWHRVKTSAIEVGIGIGTGYVISKKF